MKNLINGAGKWSQVQPKERKEFITDVCDIASKSTRLGASSPKLESEETHRAPS